MVPHRRMSGAGRFHQSSEKTALISSAVLASAGAMPLVTVGDANEFVLNEEAVALLQMLKCPVCPIAIAGLYRTGKSSLLNWLLDRPGGFKVGPTVELVRTALALGWDAVALLPGTCDPYNDKVRKSDPGDIFSRADSAAAPPRRTVSSPVVVAAVVVVAVFR